MALSVLAVPNVSALRSFVDDFEDDSVPNQPSSDFYTVIKSGGTLRTSNDATAFFGVVVNHTRVSGGGSFAFAMEDEGVDLCDSGVVKLRFKLHSLPSTVSIQFSIKKDANSLEGDGTLTALGFRVSDVGAVTAVKVLAGVPTTQTLTGLTIAGSTWYNVTMNYPVCGSGGNFQVYFPDQDILGQVATMAAQATALSKFGVEATDAGTQSWQFHMDKLELTGINDPPPESVGAAATVAVTDMVGFDVDKANSNSLIARVNGGENVEAYNPITLDQLGATTDTDCTGHVDGVSATSQYIAFLDCTPAGLIEKMKIRTPSLGTPSFPGCNTSDVCPDEIDMDSVCGDFAGAQENFKEIRTFDFAAWDYSSSFENFGDPNSRSVSWAFSTALGGKYGVAEYTAINNACDTLFEEIQSIGSASAIEQLCAWSFDGKHFLGIADGGIAPRVHEWLPKEGEDKGLAVQDGDLSGATSYSGAASAIGIACAQDRIAFLTNTQVHVVNLTSGALIKSFTTAGAPIENGIAISNNGDFIAYTDGADVLIVHTDNLTQVGTVVIPSGTYVGHHLSNSAKQLWIGTSTTISRFEIATVTSGVGGCDSADCVPAVTPIATDGVGLFGDSGPTIGDALGVGTFGGNLFLGVFVMLASTVGTAGAIGLPSRSGLGLGIGAFVGFVGGIVLAWSFGFFDAKTIFSIVILCITIIGFAFFLRRG